MQALDEVGLVSIDVSVKYSLWFVLVSGVNLGSAQNGIVVSGSKCLGFRKLNTDNSIFLVMNSLFLIILGSGAAIM
jgi:hypothetical protein